MTDPKRGGTNGADDVADNLIAALRLDRVMPRGAMPAAPASARETKTLTDVRETKTLTDALETKTVMDLRDALPPEVMAYVPPAMHTQVNDAVRNYRGPFEPPKPQAPASGFDKAFQTRAAGPAFDSTLIPEEMDEATNAVLAAARAAEAAEKPRSEGPRDVQEMLARMRASYGNASAWEVPAGLKKL